MASNPSNVYSASGLSEAVGQVGELALPTCPRFVDDLLCLPSGEGVYILGGESQYLGGATVEWLFSNLIPALDGKTTLEKLRERFAELPSTSLDDMLFLLQMHGMIEAGSTEFELSRRSPPDRSLESQMIFFSRYLRITGRRSCRYEAQLSIEKSPVLVCGSGPQAAQLTAGLKDHGVDCRASIDEELDELDASQWSILISVGDYAQQSRIAQECSSRNLPVLFCDFSRLLLGPLTIPGATACPTCVRHQIGHELEQVELVSNAIHTLWRRVLVERALQRVLSFITQLYQTNEPAMVELWQPATSVVSTFDSVLCLPSCETCGSETTRRSLRIPGGHLESASLLFHRSTCIKPWDIDHPADMQRHFALDVMRLTQTAFRQYSGAQAVSLPKAELSKWDVPLWQALAQSESGVGKSCDASSISHILRYSAGGEATQVNVGTFHIKRFTASGGNLGSAELYLVICSKTGIPTDVYHYSVIEDALEELPCPTDPVPQNWFGHDLNATVNIIIVSDVARGFEKYGGRAYTYSLLDAGLMSHRIRLLASTVGLSSELTWVFDDDQISRLLGISPPNLVPTCIIRLGG